MYKMKDGDGRNIRRSRKKTAWAAYGITAGIGLFCALALTLVFYDGGTKDSGGVFRQNTVYEENQPGSIEYGSVGVSPELAQADQSKEPVQDESAQESAWEPQEAAGAPEEAEDITQDTSDREWKLILVNRWNPIPENYQVTLTELQNGQAVDSRIYPELQAMFDDARAEGLLPMITSSYRTSEYQQSLMDEKIAEYQTQGYSEEEAKALAEKWVAIPGTSEHEIGMAVDISTADSSLQDASIVWEWLRDNSYKYGFILRYTEEKTDITGVIDEPWHYRYVGKEAAKEIYEQGLCLEEYLEK